MKTQGGYEASQAANFVLDNFDSVDFGITNLKLQKTLYVIHGYTLARLNTPFVRNHFECWDHGPVISSLYHKLKTYKDLPIQRIRNFSYEKNCEIVTEYDCRFEFAKKEILGVLASTLRTDVWALVDRTHALGTAWYDVKQSLSDGSKSNRIPNERIARDFADVFGGSRPH